MRTRRIPVVALLVALLAVPITGCGSDKKDDNAAQGESKETTTTTDGSLKSLGAGEGAVNLIAWAGYVEKGENDPKVDWITGFEKESGCKVTTKVAGTSDEMVSLIKTGEYDTVSASGDASLRLIASGDVEPVNTDLVPNYADVFDGLKNKPWNSVDNVPYGVPHGRGANLLMYRTDEVSPAPDSWSVVFDGASDYAVVIRWIGSGQAP